MNGRFPHSDMEAAQLIEQYLDHSAKQLAQLEKEEFIRLWEAIAFLFGGLHPDSTDHGVLVDDPGGDGYLKSQIDERLRTPYYETSGWPRALVPILDEAWRRHKNERFEDEEMYPSDAQRAGIEWRMEGAGR